jgi:hypothetical protein
VSTGRIDSPSPTLSVSLTLSLSVSLSLSLSSAPVPVPGGSGPEGHTPPAMTSRPKTVRVSGVAKSVNHR